jgi:hypothetical protein
MPTNKPRLTINLSNTEYAELADLAHKHSLSMAWIGHKAILEFLEAHRENQLQLPLTKGPRRPTWPTNEGLK